MLYPHLDSQKVPESPCWVIDLEALEANLTILAEVERRAGCKILLALKGFAAWRTFPLVKKYLSGATASAPHEARLARDYIDKEVHAYAPAYSDQDVEELCLLCDHIIFNSFSQWRKFRGKVLRTGISCGIRINPEHREVKVPLYDPCAPRSRLGVTFKQFHPEDLEGVDGLHFHTLCELGSDALERTFLAFEQKFAKYLKGLKWINLGGGHHITRPDYDIEKLIQLVTKIKKKYDLDVYLEPGEAIAINTGVLVATVLDIIENDGPLAILDISATAHMPDVLEMPYRPEILKSGKPQEWPHTYLLGGLSCLAGDVIGEYSFPEPLEIGQRLTFLDMSHYTMVKTTNFNGVKLPSIALRHKDDRYELVKSFSYESYRDRLS
jgi:carboxynorspermidine decarboxylase